MDYLKFKMLPIKMQMIISNNSIALDRLQDSLKEQYTYKDLYACKWFQIGKGVHQRRILSPCLI